MTFQLLFCYFVVGVKNVRFTDNYASLKVMCIFKKILTEWICTVQVYNFQSFDIRRVAMEGAVGTWQRETRAALPVGQILPTFLQVCAHGSKIQSQLKSFYKTK